MDRRSSVCKKNVLDWQRMVSAWSACVCMRDSSHLRFHIFQAVCEFLGGSNFWYDTKTLSKVCLNKDFVLNLGHGCGVDSQT